LESVSFGFQATDGSHRGIEILRAAFGGKQNPEYWQTVFESGKTPQNQQILPSGINLMKMIQG
jgi:hypothetical protein